MELNQGEENISILMVTVTSVNGKMIKKMVKENTNIKTKTATKESTKMV